MASTRGLFGSAGSGRYRGDGGGDSGAEGWVKRGAEVGVLGG